jgi:hypothetical protein
MSKSIFDQLDSSADQDSLPLSDWLRSVQGEASGSEWLDQFLPKELAGHASETANWLTSLALFGMPAAQPSAESVVSSVAQETASPFPAAAAATPSTNLKVAIAQTLYPGIPVF